ncbi:MAG: rRNA maturation RNase YbeY [Flavobacteriales bacterium]|jgi:rRNA maturation RNase YbeY|tara:strand:+ start:574 stop:981 length:408 start_codon:yes stop_codon:yes gene_type:complete
MITFQNTSKFKVKDLRKKKIWLNSISKNEGKDIGSLNFLFVDDKEMLKYNKKYLQHESYTDIITFDNSLNNKIAGDIVISLERVNENAKYYQVSYNYELERVMAHGLLHLLGYNDKNKEEKIIIRKKENYYLKNL